MTNAIVQVGLFFIIVALLSVPLGLYMARVFNDERTFLDPVLRPLERLIYRVSGIRPATEMTWFEYAISMLLFSMSGMLLLYAIQRLQQLLPFNPQAMGAVAPDLAFNTAASFTTNTNWQAYGGESTMSYLTQMGGLAFHNFVSAAAGIAIAIAVIRGFVRKTAKTIGNFWFDLTRATLWVLLPISVVFALVLVWQGVPDNLSPYTHAKTLEGADQVIAQGPVASQEIIKELGTNGGGFFNANSSHPYENPTPLTNLLEMVAIFVIGAGANSYLRQDGWRSSPGVGAIRRHGTSVFHGCRRPRSGPSSAAIPSSPRWGLIRSFGHPVRRQHGGQGSPLRHRQLRTMGDRHHRYFMRRGQRDARQLHAAGRSGPAGQHADRRDHLRRRRFRPLRDAGDGGAVRLHRGTDGGSHAGIPR